MSEFSGECDFKDEIEIFGLNHILNSNIYVGTSDVSLKLTCLNDCVPYYAHLVLMEAHDNKNHRGIIRLTSKPWFEIEAKRYGKLSSYEYYKNKLETEIKRTEKERTNNGT